VGNGWKIFPGNGRGSLGGEISLLRVSGLVGRGVRSGGGIFFWGVIMTGLGRNLTGFRLGRGGGFLGVEKVRGVENNKRGAESERIPGGLKKRVEHLDGVFLGGSLETTLRGLKIQRRGFMGLVRGAETRVVLAGARWES